MVRKIASRGYHLHGLSSLYSNVHGCSLGIKDRVDYESTKPSTSLIASIFHFSFGLCALLCFFYCESSEVIVTSA